MANHLVIMAGGIGSRFWPLSTPQCPKQFLDITGCGRTMIQQTFDRFDGIIDIDHVWVVTSANFCKLVSDQLAGINPQHILLEPCMRNTAPCIAYVSWKIKMEDPSALVVVAPSDHLILNVDRFKDVVRKGLSFVSEGKKVLTLGMTPTRPETGYGYIEQGENVTDSIFKLRAFREKPNLSTAIEYIKKGGFTWNSGMFLWSVDTIIEELRSHAPQISDVMDKMSESFFTENEQSVVNDLFPTCEKISIDYAVMEKTQVGNVLPAEFGWSDLGTWGSLHTLSMRDSDDNAVIGDNVSIIESRGCMVSVPSGKKIVIQGLEDCIVAEHDNTLLICKMSQEQRIKEWHD